MTISEKITELGKDFYKDFSIENEPIRSFYKKTYEGMLFEQKGVLLVGSIGCGKTTMVRVLHRLLRDTDRCFKFVTAKDLKYLLEESSPATVKEKYGKSLRMNLYIDDIGIFLNQNKYGNVTNIISELIFERSELFCETGIKTHFSSNTPPISGDKNIETLATMYGERVYDRLVEMCDLISWQSKSLRK
jgi:DNA replication protein DnaC